MITLSKPVSFAFALILSSAYSQEAPPPAELQKLRSTYDAEIKRVTEMPKRRYLEALERLQSTYTRDGALEKALLVREEIREIREAGAAETEMAVNEKILYGSEWRWGSGGTLTLERNGDASHTAWSVPGSWKKTKDGTVLIQRPGQDPPMIVVFSDENLTDAVVTSPLGGKTTLRRVIK